jgi:hypothetical protein
LQKLFVYYLAIFIQCGAVHRGLDIGPPRRRGLNYPRLHYDWIALSRMIPFPALHRFSVTAKKPDLWFLLGNPMRYIIICINVSVLGRPPGWLCRLEGMLRRMRPRWCGQEPVCRLGKNIFPLLVRVYPCYSRVSGNSGNTGSEELYGEES